MKYTTIHTTTSIALALCAIFGVAWLVFALVGERTALAGLALTYGEAEQKSAYAASIRALLRGTQAERGELNALTADRDPVEVIRLLEEAARGRGVSLSIDAVNPGGASRSDPALSSFLVAAHASGSFERLHRLVELFGSLPFPSFLEQVKLEQSKDGWQAHMVLRVFADEK